MASRVFPGIMNIGDKMQIKNELRHQNTVAKCNFDYPFIFAIVEIINRSILRLILFSKQIAFY